MFTTDQSAIMVMIFGAVVVIILTVSWCAFWDRRCERRQLPAFDVGLQYMALYKDQIDRLTTERDNYRDAELTTRRVLTEALERERAIFDRERVLTCRLKDELRLARAGHDGNAAAINGKHADPAVNNVVKLKD